MDSTFKENKYFNTYYYANIVNNILTRDISLIGFISDFFADEEALFYLAKPFQRFSAFHEFIKQMTWRFLDDDMCTHDEEEHAYYLLNKPKYTFRPYGEWVLENYNLQFPFSEFIRKEEEISYEDVEKYHDQLRLCGLLEEVVDKITEEVFYLMFNNRGALLKFNYLVAEYLRELNYELSEDEDRKFKKLFTRKGTLKRAPIPEWSKKAVFYRDRGVCCNCHSDLTGLINLLSNKNFDHIVPLALGGLNDVSNLQLLCSKCNNAKSAHEIYTSAMYQFWF